MENKLNVQVGSKVWIKPRNYGRTEREPHEETVTKMGRKYFYVNHIKFSLETGLEETDGNYADRAYSSLQEIIDEKEWINLYDEIRQNFSHYKTQHLTLSQLRAIKNIIAPV